jgi:excisionase family DNA binding protein
MTTLEPLLGVKEVARILAVSTRSVNRLVARGDLRPVWVGGVRRFEPAAIRAYLERLGEPGDAPAFENFEPGLAPAERLRRFGLLPAGQQEQYWRALGDAVAKDRAAGLRAGE